MLRASALWRIEMAAPSFQTFAEAVEHFKELGYTELVVQREGREATYRKPGPDAAEAVYVDIYPLWYSNTGYEFVGMEY